MKIIKIGSRWWTGRGVHFVVTDIVEDNGNTWVHYCNKDSTQKYSCYIESFLERFTGLLE